MHRRDPEAYVNARPMDAAEKDRRNAEDFNTGNARRKVAPRLEDLDAEGAEVPATLFEGAERW
jgi:hypothetical protein